MHDVRIGRGCDSLKMCMRIPRALGGRMRSQQIWIVVSQAYDIVHLALWSVLIAGLICFALFVLPDIPAAQARYAAARALEIQSTQDLYCRKLGMKPGSLGYRDCLLDLQDYRATIERRLAENFF